MAEDLIRYDLLVQDALRGVVRRVLTDAAQNGLSGEHHFYISFRTEAPGVRMSQRLREKYPQDMTIVLQHQFWDLGITEHTFEVGLSFSGVPERLLIPFDALTGFFDPSVQFGLKFDLNDGTEAGADEVEAAAPKPGPRGAASEPAEVRPKGPASIATIAGGPSPRVVPGAGPRNEEADGEDKPSDATQVRPKAADKSADKAPRPAAEKGAEAKEGSAEVVSLDAFRKKS